MVNGIPLISTAYLPSIEYMALLAKHPVVAIEQHETFPKQTFRNRTQIATGNGVLTLNVPVSRPDGNHTSTNNITVSYHEPWNVRHWRAILSAYNAAPYFLYYRDGLEAILLKRHELLIELNSELTQYLMDKLKIECSLEFSSSYVQSEADFRDLRVKLTAKQKLTDLRFPSYSQVFGSRYGFVPNLSVIDLLFNLGPEAKGYLMHLSE